jgi:hypothetical protein
MSLRLTRGATLIALASSHLPKARRADIIVACLITYLIGTLRLLEVLIRELGGLDECRRLGFVFEDANKIMSLSVAGIGYLCFVKAAGNTGVAEAFAAGYQCAAEEYEAKLDKV